jgi:hypothetical protein
MVPTGNTDKIMAALAFLTILELFFTLVVALTCALVLVGCGIFSEATPAPQITKKPPKAGLVRQDF